MGGPGSGRKSWHTSKERLESKSSIDIRWLKKQGYLRGEISGVLWESAGKTRCHSTAEYIHIKYNQRPHRSAEWESIEQVIYFAKTSCYFGGYRTWFVCPKCDKRVAVLYKADRNFLCRHCNKLTYASQQEGRVDRLMRKARKIRQRLGASGNLAIPIWFKPINMHQKTFDRLRYKADNASNRSLLIIGQQHGIIKK